jgi:hypothetical protein
MIKATVVRTIPRQRRVDRKALLPKSQHVLARYSRPLLRGRNGLAGDERNAAVLLVAGISRLLYKHAKSF